MLDVNLPDGDGITLAGALTGEAAVVLVSTLDESALGDGVGAPVHAGSYPRPNCASPRFW